jgi:hypothetical protein
LNETSNFKEGKWQYHDYRNSNINNFHKTIEWLTKQGIWVIRMGSDQYKADGIEITEMTENKILNVTKEFYIQNTQKSSNKIKPNKTEKLFWKKLIMANKNLKSLTHNKIHPKSNVSKTWLKSLNKLKNRDKAKEQN